MPFLLICALNFAEDVLPFKSIWIVRDEFLCQNYDMFTDMRQQAIDEHGLLSLHV